MSNKNASESSQNMTLMISKAVAWWCEQLVSSPNVNKETINRFEKHLHTLLTQKIKDHWFLNKGQGYRSISLDKKGLPDPVLIKAAKGAGIENLYDCFSYVESIVMWIDPDEIAVKMYWAYSQGGKEQVIFKPNSPLISPNSQKLNSSPTSNHFLPNTSISDKNLQSKSLHLLSPLHSSPTRLVIRPPPPHYSPPSYPHVFQTPSYTAPRPPSPTQPAPYPHPHKPYHTNPRPSVYRNPYLQQLHPYSNWHNGTNVPSYVESTWRKQQHHDQQQAPPSTSEGKVYYNSEIWHSGLPLEAQA